MITSAQLDRLEAIETKAMGTPIEVHVLSPQDNQRRLPVAFIDGRGIPLQGHITGINLLVQFDDGTHAWVHPARIRTPEREPLSSHSSRLTDR